MYLFYYRLVNIWVYNNEL